MSIFVTICFICALLAFFGGLFVLAADRKSRLNQTWFVFNISVFLWAIGLAGTMSSGDKGSALAAQRILYVGTALMPVLFSYMSGLLVESPGKAKKMLAINSFIAGFFLTALFFTKLFIEKILEPNSFGYYPFDVGPLYYPFLLWWLGSIAHSLYLLKKGRKNELLDIVRRQNISFLLWGALVGFGAGAVNFLLDFGILIPPFYNLLVPSYLLFVGYAIVTKQFFGIKVILTQLLVFGMGIILLVLPFFMPNLILQIVMMSVFVVFCVFGYMLVKAILKEVNQKEILAGMVQDRTKELEQSKKVAEERAAELERWYKLTIGREVRMAELKEKIKEMEEKVEIKKE
ncbi:MAG: histidine kinase N-terminal 7TM domain-containing protein [Candidatus Paceibacterota bacterium]|jgi:membrane protein implicated in regulation of membrane protease activity